MFAPATDVPWSAIGPGWFLVAVDRHRVRPQLQLLLVGSTGHRYRVYTSPRGTHRSVVGWSGDGQRVLLEDAYSRRHVTYVVDLRAGRAWRLDLPADVQAAGFTLPRGQGLLTTADTDLAIRYRLERRDLYGRRPVVLSTNATGIGVYVPRGTALLVPEGRRLTLVSNMDGRPLRTLPGSQGCFPVRMWDATTVLAHCPTSLSLFSLTGGASTVLLRPAAQRGHGYQGQDIDDVDAWLLPDGLYTYALGACGYRFIGRMKSNGHIDPVRIPDTAGNTVPVTAWRGRLAVAAIQGCEGPAVPSLLWFDPTTKAEQVLWAPRSGDLDPQFVPYQASDVASPIEASTY